MLEASQECYGEQFGGMFGYSAVLAAVLNEAASFAIWGRYVKSTFSVVPTGSFEAASC